MRTLANIASIFSLMLLASSLMISCVSIKSHLKYTHRSSTAPIDAFAFVMVNHEVKPDKCLPSPREEECNEIINQLPSLKSRGSGSGLLVWTKTRPVFLTAAHVCTADHPEIYEADDMVFTLVSDVSITVRGVTGEALETEIIKINNEKDLCALDVPKMNTAPVKVSHREPKVGDAVYAISAPFGINTPTLNLVFSGYYSGYDDRWHYYTIPTRPGSSGSVVLNKDFKAIGMLNAAFLDIEHIGLGASYKDLVEFLSDIP